MADANAPDGAVVTVGSSATDRDVLIRAVLDNIPQIVPGVPNSAWMPILLGQARGVLGALGGLGIGWAKGVTGDQVTLYVSAALIVVALVWSAWQKVYAIIAKYKAQAVTASATAAATATASASAPAGTAVPVAVLPLDPRMPIPAAVLQRP